MTNEEIVLLIKRGKTEYCTQLWENTRRLMYKLLQETISKRRLPNYISVEDAKQELYFAMCNAVQTYDEHKGCVFTSYLHYYVKNAVRSMFSTNQLNTRETSYNVPVGDEYETELIDLMPDKETEDIFMSVELTDLQTIVRQAVSELPERIRTVIELYYFRAFTFSQIAEMLSISPQGARNTRARGLKLLKSKPSICKLHDEFTHHSMHSEHRYEMYNFMWSVSKERIQVENELFRRMVAGEYISYGEEQKIIFEAKRRYIYAHASNDNCIQRLCRTD